jgi:hypothetical protein
MRRVASQQAQASVELIAIVPLLIVSALALGQTLVACWALLSAGEAARSAARIVHVGGDAKEAAGKSLPGLLEPADVDVDGARVRIEVRAPALLPGVPGIPVAASAALDPEGGG